MNATIQKIIDDLDKGCQCFIREDEVLLSQSCDFMVYCGMNINGKLELCPICQAKKSQAEKDQELFKVYESELKDRLCNQTINPEVNNIIDQLSSKDFNNLIVHKKRGKSVRWSISNKLYNMKSQQEGCKDVPDGQHKDGLVHSQEHKVEVFNPHSADKKHEQFVSELKGIDIVLKITSRLNEVSEEKENEEGDSILTFDEMETPILQVINKYIETLNQKLFDVSGDKLK